MMGGWGSGRGGGVGGGSRRRRREGRSGGRGDGAGGGKGGMPGGGIIVFGVAWWVLEAGRSVMGLERVRGVTMVGFGGVATLGNATVAGWVATDAITRLHSMRNRLPLYLPIYLLLCP